MRTRSQLNTLSLEELRSAKQKLASEKALKDRQDKLDAERRSLIGSIIKLEGELGK